MKTKHLSISSLFIGVVLMVNSPVLAEMGVTIIDARHYSHVFGETRNYRIFLPRGYYQNPDKKYPVIYFLHGWSQRYFGSGDEQYRYAEYDRGKDNSGENMENFASTHEVIIVKSDGYNPIAGEEYYLRPYNIGPVESYRQFPIYFPELIDHIDATYQTKAQREGRAITGLSMGGFMSFVIAGKYSDLFCAAGNFCGSPEFVIGPKEMPVEYRHADMYKNYGGLKVRLHYGDKDFIRGYHEDMNRVWTQVMDNYEYKIFPGEHTTSGFNEMFNFLFATFSNPLPTPLKWDHIEIYPAFSVRDYNVKTDRIIPGFTILENVSKRGFRCSVREFLPDGELIAGVNISVVTAPIYEKNQWYVVNDLDTKNLRQTQATIQSDHLGRLKISFNGSIHEIGINRKTDGPNLAIADFETGNKRWATPGQDQQLVIKLLNKGFTIGKEITATLSATTNDVSVIKGDVFYSHIPVNGLQVAEQPFVFRVLNDTIEMIRFKLTITDKAKNKWEEFFEMPVIGDLPGITNFEIADGRIFTVVKKGIDSETGLIGHGNGDGIANPGESIEILVKDQNKYWRTRLISLEGCINPFGINIRRSDNWASFDNVGGSMKYSVAVLSSDCSAKGNINFIAEYWQPDKPLHIIKRKKIVVPVIGNDKTPPVVAWVKVPGDNILRVKMYDGSRIISATATVIAKNQKTYRVELNDNGTAGDKVANDRVFCGLTTVPEIGFYRVVIEATDLMGNRLLQEIPETFLFH